MMRDKLQLKVLKKITNKTKIIALTHLSNVTGAILPIKEITISRSLKKYTCAY